MITRKAFAMLCLFRLNIKNWGFFISTIPLQLSFYYDDAEIACRMPCIDTDACSYRNPSSGYDPSHNKDSFLPICFTSFILMIAIQHQ